MSCYPVGGTLLPSRTAEASSDLYFTKRSTDASIRETLLPIGSSGQCLGLFLPCRRGVQQQTDPIFRHQQDDVRGRPPLRLLPCLETQTIRTNSGSGRVSRPNQSLDKVDFENLRVARPPHRRKIVLLKRIFRGKNSCMCPIWAKQGLIGHEKRKKTPYTYLKSVLRSWLEGSQNSRLTLSTGC